MDSESGGRARAPNKTKPAHPALILLGMLMVSSASAAPYAHTLTGEQFVNMMNRPQPLSSQDYLEREKAYSYLDGARDHSEGREWCDVNQLKTHDLAQELAQDIQKLSTQARKRNASMLLVEQLRRKYPCRHGEGKP